MSGFAYTPTRLMLPSSHYDARRADFAVNFIRKLDKALSQVGAICQTEL